MSIMGFLRAAIANSPVAKEDLLPGDFAGGEGPFILPGNSLQINENRPLPTPVQSESPGIPIGRLGTPFDFMQDVVVRVVRHKPKDQ